MDRGEGTIAKDQDVLRNAADLNRGAAERVSGPQSADRVIVHDQLAAAPSVVDHESCGRPSCLPRR